MPTITLPDPYDQKLKQLVVDPFEQTRESIIKDLIDAEIGRRSVGTSVPPPRATDGAIRLKPGTPGNLVHSKVVSATIDGHEVHRPKWNGVREHLHLIALKRFGSFGALQKASDARLRTGKHESDGFKYLPEGDFSIQGVDANLAWEHSLKLAKAMSVPIKLSIVWRDKEGAAHPGKAGVLEWSADQEKVKG